MMPEPSGNLYLNSDTHEEIHTFASQVLLKNAILPEQVSTPQLYNEKVVLVG
jgi:hypothetical protein